MPSIAQESPTVQSSRKRRRDGNDHQIHPATNTPHGIFHQDDRTHHSSASANRKIIPIPPGKRQRTLVDIELEVDGEPMQRSPSNSPPQRHHHGLHHLHREHQQTRDASRVEEDTRSRSTLPTPTAAPPMSRCHICSRKPNKKSDLDSFADCEGCGQRTCYVCIRECLGWGGGGGGGGPSPYPYAHSPTTTQTQPQPQSQPQPQRRAQPHNPHPAVSEGPHHSARALPSPATATTTTSIGGASAEEAGEVSFTMLDADDEEQQQAQHDDVGRREHEQGWTTGGGHKRVVCSRCCVERGQDGEVVCLGCLPFVEG
ncbi:hypothetical protein F5144DRAFT_55708 [Chaetomium tenue]|uniref:Uncharacterized protein n=1 Tax=Chaetomium tenue TaxID=1854479 RepID=A0ACB7PRH5_9PEZI|nr:hypothetical protein F5144DRAFT_55708 [Chaetomium globosum]